MKLSVAFVPLLPGILILAPLSLAVAVNDGSALTSLSTTRGGGWFGSSPEDHKQKAEDKKKCVEVHTKKAIDCTKDYTKEKAKQVKESAADAIDENAWAARKREEELLAKTDRAVGRVQQKAHDGYETLKSAKDTAKTKVKHGVHRVGDAVEYTYDTTRDTLKGAKDSVVGAARGTKDSVVGAARGTKDRVVGAAREGESKVEHLYDSTKDTLKGAARNTRDTARSARDSAADAGRDARDSLADAGRDARRGLDRTYDRAADAGRDARRGLDRTYDRAADAGRDARRGIDGTFDRAADAGRDARRGIDRTYDRTADRAYEARRRVDASGAPIYDSRGYPAGDYDTVRSKNLFARIRDALFGPPQPRPFIEDEGYYVPDAPYHQDGSIVSPDAYERTARRTGDYDLWTSTTTRRGLFGRRGLDPLLQATRKLEEEKPRLPLETNPGTFRERYNAERNQAIDRQRNW